MESRTRGKERGGERREERREERKDEAAYSISDAFLPLSIGIKSGQFVVQQKKNARQLMICSLLQRTTQWCNMMRCGVHNCGGLHSIPDTALR